MISKRVFSDLNMNMRKVCHEDGILNLDFDGKSMLLIGVFLQPRPSGWMNLEHLPPINAQHLFELHKLSEIVRQNSDPELVVRVGEQTQSDIAAIHAMTDTDISDCLENHLRSYMTNHLVGKQNMEVMNNATNTIFTIYAVDGRANGHTGAFQYNLSDDIDITKTGNLKKILKLWVGARVQLTDNLDVENKLCNGSEVTVKIYPHL